MRHLKKKWKRPETTETTPGQSKLEPAGETGLRPCWCVTALFGQEAQHQSYVHHVLKKASVKHYKCQEAQLTSRGSEPGWGKWTGDPIRAAPESNPPNVPQSLPIAILSTFWLFGSPVGRSLQGWLASRYRGSAEALDHSMPAGHGLGAWNASRCTFEKRPTNILRFSLTWHEAIW